MYGVGISREGSALDMAIELDIVNKAVLGSLTMESGWDKVVKNVKTMLKDIQI
jgi:hypothetical protein